MLALNYLLLVTQRVKQKKSHKIKALKASAGLKKKNKMRTWKTFHLLLTNVTISTNLFMLSRLQNDMT